MATDKEKKSIIYLLGLVKLYYAIFKAYFPLYKTIPNPLQTWPNWLATNRDGTANSNQAKMLGLNQTDNVPLREQAYPNRSIFKPLLQKAAISDTVTSSQDSICCSNLTEPIEQQDVPLPPSPALSQEKRSEEILMNFVLQKTQSKATSMQCIHQMEQQYPRLYTLRALIFQAVVSLLDHLWL